MDNWKGVGFLFYDCGTGGEFITGHINKKDMKKGNINTNRYHYRDLLSARMRGWGVIEFDAGALSTRPDGDEYRYVPEKVNESYLKMDKKMLPSVVTLSHLPPSGIRDIFPEAPMLYITASDRFMDDYAHKLCVIKCENTKAVTKFNGASPFINILAKQRALEEGIHTVGMWDILYTDILFETFGVDIKEELLVWHERNIEVIEEYERARP